MKQVQSIVTFDMQLSGADEVTFLVSPRRMLGFLPRRGSVDQLSSRIRYSMSALYWRRSFLQSQSYPQARLNASYHLALLFV